MPTSTIANPVRAKQCGHKTSRPAPRSRMPRVSFEKWQMGLSKVKGCIHSGIVATRSAEPGEIVAPGTVVVTIFNPQQVYLRAFIPEGDIGRVRTGQLARVYLDSNPKLPLDAVVARIDPQASFTPENTYFRDDRVKQVVGVKLQIVNAQGFAKPGMPADGEVLVEGDSWVATNR